MRYGGHCGFILSLLLCACTSLTSQEDTFYGIQDKYREYIPAKIAVFPAQLWPQENLQNSNLDSTVADHIIRETSTIIDTKIQEAFTDQPYLHGLTPTALQETLTTAKQGTLINDLQEQWVFQKQSEHCKNCDNPFVFYQEILAHKASWLKGLNELARATAYCDAVLIPFLYTIRHDQWNDRGLLVSQRQIRLALFLIDSPTGELIWIKNRNVQHNHKDTDHYPDYPKWPVLYTQLFVNHLWQGFPGMKRHS